MGDQPSVFPRVRIGAALVAGTLLAGMLLAAPATNAEPPSAGSPDVEVGAAADLTSKPYAPGSIQIDASELTTGGDTVTVVSDPDAGFTDASITTSAAGPAVELVGDATEAVPAGPTERTFTVEVPDNAGDDAEALIAQATSSEGVSTVSATLKAADGTGSTRSISDQVWVTEFDGATLVSETGEQDLRLQKVGHLQSSGAVDGDTAAGLRRTIQGATGSRVSATAADCTGVCVSGTVKWTDSEGGTHPVPFAPVQIRDDETPPVGAESELITTVTTALDGTYSASVDNDDGVGQGDRDVFVRVLAAGEDFSIGGQFIESPVTAEVASGTELTIDLTANNTDDNNTAFSLQNAMYLGTKYLDTRVDGGLRFLDVVYPDPDGSFYDTEKLHVLALDRFDWDVMLHEYGHFVANELDIENNPGGNHSSADNLSVTRGSKEIGVPLAFGEGWPTYFAVTLLQIQDVAALGVPNAGDSLYQDTEDQVITDDLEAGGSLGEDNEYTVMSVLWDLYDTPEDGLDKVALGDKVVWDRLVAGGTDDPGTLSDAYRLLALDGVGAADPVSCVFSGLNVAPRLEDPGVTNVGKDDTVPTFTWAPGNGGDFPNDSFVVELRDASGNTLLESSDPLDDTSYTPSEAEWLSALRKSEGTVRIAVVGTQTAEPVTGPYRSCMADIGVNALADAGGPYNGTAGEAVTLDASDSVVPGGSITNYEWDFDGDGTYDQSTTTPTTTHVYGAPFEGTLKVRITAGAAPSTAGLMSLAAPGDTDVAEASVEVAAAPVAPSSNNNPPSSENAPTATAAPTPVAAPAATPVAEPLPLARTGADSRLLMLIGAGLILAGAALQLRRRRA
ncbi:MAG: PKD domain-containing protein [Microthrixaceae bacterium]